jgi:hypothetical protein
MTRSPHWKPGSQIVYREVWRGRVWTARPVTVVQDAPDLIVLYLCSGARWKFPAPVDGDEEHPHLFHYLLATESWRLIDLTWTWGDTLFLVRPGEAHAVHAMWREPDRAFEGWYINLQEPVRRTRIGFDSMDQDLDIVVSPDLSTWSWKDEEPFRHGIEIGLFTNQQVREIRAEGKRVIERVRAKASPFDDGWEDWVPDPAWPVPELPQAWDQI